MGTKAARREKKDFAATCGFPSPAYAFDQRARTIGLKETWKNRFDPSLKHEAADIPVGAVAAGEKVIGSSAAKLRSIFGMRTGTPSPSKWKAAAFSTAFTSIILFQGCVVRGISDLLDDKSQQMRSGFRRLLPAAAAATYEMLATFPSLALSHPMLFVSRLTNQPRRACLRRKTPGINPAFYFEPRQILAEFGGVGTTKRSFDF